MKTADDYFDEDGVTFGETGSADRERSVLDVGFLTIALCPLPGSGRVVAWVPSGWKPAGWDTKYNNVIHPSVGSCEPLFVVHLHLTVWESGGAPWAQWVVHSVCTPVPGQLAVTPVPRAPYLSHLQRAIDRWVRHMWAGDESDFPLWFPKN